jgi:ABC-type Zn uptake system ZnuABC Zn-binding protein ZnuA
MKRPRALSMLCLVALLVIILGIVYGFGSEHNNRLSVAVAESDIEAIVKAVGGDQVDTFSLIRECILKSNLQVEPDVLDRLARADVVVWSGFLRESAAINAGLDRVRTASNRAAPPEWIDVSKGAARVDLPTTTCYGDNDYELVSGDPFFWLNPQNGSVIAQNIAYGLSELKPDKRAYFLANADKFATALDSDINRWKEQLSPLSELRVFTTLCGWQNFSSLGGPHFIVCNETPGVLPKPDNLVEQLKRVKTNLVLVDPNTSLDYVKAFREETGFTVIEVPSSIDKIPGAQTYSELFENMIQALLKGAKESARS